MLILQVKQSYVDSRPTLRQGLARAWFQQRLSRHVGPGSVRPVCGPSAERGAKRWEPDEQTPGSRDMHSGSTAKCLISKADAISTPTPTAVQNGTPLELRRHRHSRRSSYAAPTGLSGRRAIGKAAGCNVLSRCAGWRVRPDRISSGPMIEVMALFAAPDRIWVSAKGKKGSNPKTGLNSGGLPIPGVGPKFRCVAHGRRRIAKASQTVERSRLDPNQVHTPSCPVGEDPIRCRVRRTACPFR